MITLRGRIDQFDNLTDGKFVIENQDAKRVISLEECASFSRSLNEILKDDKELHEMKLLPINPEKPATLFYALDNGITLCKLLLVCDEKCGILQKAINKDQNMSAFKIAENLNMGIATAKSMGIRLIGIN